MERNIKNSKELTKESESELNLKHKKNAIEEKNSSCSKRSNKCKNKRLIEKCNLRMEFDGREVNTTEKKPKNIFDSSNDSIDLKAKHKLLDNREKDSIEKQFSPIEQFRTDPDPATRHWQQYHTSTSTPTQDSGKTAIPELNVSNISFESNDSDMLFERQISRFQITDEILHSISIDSIVLNELDNS